MVESLNLSRGPPQISRSFLCHLFTMLWQRLNFLRCFSGTWFISSAIRGYGGRGAYGNFFFKEIPQYMGRQGWSSCFPSQTLGCWHSLGQEGLGWDRLHQGWWLHRTLAFKVPPRNLHSSSSLSLTRDARIPLMFWSLAFYSCDPSHYILFSIACFLQHAQLAWPVNWHFIL